MSKIEFDRVGRLFPLPDLVMFPHVVQPLYVFEPRYVQLIEHAIRDDQLVTMALLKPGWQSSYDGPNPRIFKTACMGRIISHTRRDNGHYNILLAGLVRANIVQEIPTDDNHLYRRAQLNLLDDRGHPDDETVESLYETLVQHFRHMVPSGAPVDSLIDELMKDDSPSLSTLVDVMAFSMPIPQDVKQSFLAESNVYERATQLIDYLTSDMPGNPPFPYLRPFPLDFSLN